MAKIDLIIPSLENRFVDLRGVLPGDAYNFSWERLLSEVNYLAIHHSSASDSQTPEEIANLHINNNGWGGIGYHFLISKDGTVFYVGDISTARASVANLNEQVIGICLIGNFIEDRLPTNEQLDSTNRLCDFFISSYSDLVNVNSWDKVRGHKELSGQTTNCPGDNWEFWRTKIVEGISGIKVESVDDVQTTYESQINNLQASLASVNQQLISLQDTLQGREQEINELKNNKITDKDIQSELLNQSSDTTLTIIGALIKLYKFLSPSRKADSEFIGM